MIRVFKPKSLYPGDDNNEVEIDELYLDSPELYLNFCETNDVGRYYYKFPEDGGSELDWRGLRINNPYPDDEIRSQAAFMFFMHNAVNSHQGRTGLIVCSDEKDFAYCIDIKMLKKLEEQLESLQVDIPHRTK